MYPVWAFRNKSINANTRNASNMNCVGNCVTDTLTAVVEVNNHSDETHLNTLNYTNYILQNLQPAVLFLHITNSIRNISFKNDPLLFFILNFS